ncbi:MAG: response regulator [bacterium]|nr:response regulator [bacterium]
MSKKIIIIDDEPILCKVFSRCLGNAGYDVYIANDGESGLAMVQAEKPDLILMDILLPGTDGTQLAAKIRKDPMLDHIPIIMISAIYKSSDFQLQMRRIADGFMEKPISDERLLAKVREFIPLPKSPKSAPAPRSTGEGAAPKKPQKPVGPTGGKMTAVGQPPAGKAVSNAARPPAHKTMKSAAGQALNSQKIPEIELPLGQEIDSGIRLPVEKRVHFKTGSQTRQQPAPQAGRPPKAADPRAARRAAQKDTLSADEIVIRPRPQSPADNKKAPAPGKPLVQKPAAQKPAMQRHAAQKPVVQKPVAQKPVAQQPVAQQPAAQKPGMQRPVAQKPVAQRPGMQRQAAQQPAAQKPVVQKPVAQKPMAPKPQTGSLSAGRKAYEEKLAARLADEDTKETIAVKRTGTTPPAPVNTIKVVKPGVRPQPAPGTAKKTVKPTTAGQPPAGKPKVPVRQTGTTHPTPRKANAPAPTAPGTVKKTPPPNPRPAATQPKIEKEMQDQADKIKGADFDQYVQQELDDLLSNIK